MYSIYICMYLVSPNGSKMAATTRSISHFAAFSAAAICSNMPIMLLSNATHRITLAAQSRIQL